MKKIFLISLFITFIFIELSASNKIEYGFIGSACISSFKGKFKEIDNIHSVHKQSFGIGAVLNLNFTKYFSLQVEPVYVNKGGQNGKPGPDNHKIEIRYLEIPIFLKTTFKRFYLQTGGYHSILLNAKHFYKTYDRRSKTIKENTNQITNQIKPHDNGIITGIGVNIPVKETKKYFTLEIQYFYGFTNILYYEDKGDTILKNRGFSLRLGMIL